MGRETEGNDTAAEARFEEDELGKGTALLVEQARRTPIFLTLEISCVSDFRGPHSARDASFCRSRPKMQIGPSHLSDFPHNVSSCGGLRSRRVVSEFDGQCRDERRAKSSVLAQDENRIEFKMDTQVSVVKLTLWGPGSDNAPKLCPPPQKTKVPPVLEPHSNISGPAHLPKGRVRT